MRPGFFFCNDDDERKKNSTLSLSLFFRAFPQGSFFLLRRDLGLLFPVEEKFS